MIRARWRPCNSSRPSSRSGAASTRRATSRSGAATRSSSRTNSGRPRTSSPRTTCAPAPAPSSRRSPPAPTTSRSCSRPRRSRARRSMRVFAEEGLGCDVASGGELALALARRLYPARASTCTATPSRSTSCAPRARRASATSSIDNLDEIDAPRAGRRAGRPRLAAGLDPRHARRPRRHARQDLDGADRLEVRAHRSRRPRRDRAPQSQRPPRPRGRAHAHRLADPRARAVPRGRRGDRRPARRFARSTSAAASASPTRASRSRRGSTTTSTPRSQAVRDVFGEGVRVVDEPGRALVANSTVTLYTVQSVKTNVSTYVAVDGGMSDNLRPMLYGARYEAHDAVAAGNRRRPVQARGQALRVRRRDRGGCAPAGPEGGRRDRHARHRRLRLRHGQHLQRHPARRPSSSCRTATRASSCAASAPRSSSSAMSDQVFRIGLLGRGTVGGAFAELLPARAAHIEAITGHAARDHAASCARSEGDFDEILAGSDLVVEVIGGIEPARDYVLRAMRAGKHVVTANKQLLSQHGEELWALRARERRPAALRSRGRRRRARSSASSASRSPPPTSSASTASSTARPTTSSARWRATGCSYDEALADAQRLGYAEADPTEDVNGKDAAAKMAIIARLAFDTPVHLDQVTLRGHRAHHRRRHGVRARARPRAEAARDGRAGRRRPQRPRPSGVPLRQPPAGERRRPVQRRHDRVRVDHRDHAERPGRRRPADRERRPGRRHQRDDPAGLDARGHAGAGDHPATSSRPSTCTWRSPTGPACSPRSRRSSACRARR